MNATPEPHDPLDDEDEGQDRFAGLVYDEVFDDDGELVDDIDIDDAGDSPYVGPG